MLISKLQKLLISPDRENFLGRLGIMHFVDSSKMNHWPEIKHSSNKFPDFAFFVSATLVFHGLKEMLLLANYA